MSDQKLNLQKPDFNEEKATEMASLLLERSGGQMPHLKLMKLMYLSERTALLDWGYPICFDQLFSMKYGPVLSNVLDMIHEDGYRLGAYWSAHIKPCGEHEVEIIAEALPYELSEAEVELIDDIYDKYGHLDRWKLSDLTHTFPEWKNPGDGRIPIYYSEILKSFGYSDECITEILAEFDSFAHEEEMSLV